jgi:hypothetical protein
VGDNREMSGESLRVEFRRQVRERVLDAAHDQTVERGWDQVRIGEVAGRVARLVRAYLN